jgi:cell division septum initiation protein DivIVA
MENTMTQTVGEQSAVEWLVNKINSDFNTNVFFISYANEIDQAKEMEKQQQGYSEEEVKSFINSIISEIGLRKENIEKNQDKMPTHLLEGGCMAFDSSIDAIKESFEKFKNK